MLELIWCDNSFDINICIQLQAGKVRSVLNRSNISTALLLSNSIQTTNFTAEIVTQDIC
jgi:hypothetical protein